MKFAHIADTHIRNLKYHKEYKEVFEQLYQCLLEEEVDYIIHCGDIAHTKTQISPEFVDLCASFFQNLADIAPTYIILGNHDGNLKNSSRQDALTPIVDALGHPNLHLAKDSGEVLLDHNTTLNVLSVFDRDNWVQPSDDSRINIALYHGSISNCKTDLNWVMENGEDTIDIFEGFDYAMLGDIHKRQSLDTEGRVRYCGSTVQQNHGETNDKGFLLWEIENKDDFTVRHIELKNPKPFLTIELTPKGKIPRGTKIQEGARLRLVSTNNLPLDSIRKAAEISKKRFKPESVTYLNRAAGERGSVEEITNSLVKEDLRDPAVQRELIDEYLKDFHAEGDVLQRVYDLNKKYNSVLEKDEDIARNVNWKLMSLEWDNLFNYGEGNRIDFENLSGVVGVLGKNFSGKSSIIDSFLFTLFNSTSKNSRRNLNVINQAAEKGRGRVEILLNGKVYAVERESEKYIKRLKGEETLEAKTDVDFSLCNELGEVESKNGLSRNDTDKNIRKQFGTIEDFLFTSMASQHGALTFINEGSTKRKEILAKFLDLETFESKFKLAKEETADLKGALKRYEGRDFTEEIETARKELQQNEKVTDSKKRECVDLQLKVEVLKGENDAIQSRLNTMPSQVIDIVETETKLADCRSSLDELQKSNIDTKRQCEEQKAYYNKLEAFIAGFDIDQYLQERENIDQLLEEQSTLEADRELDRAKQTICSKKVELLSEVPCGEEYSSCKFIKDAYSAKKELPALLRKINTQDEKLTALQTELGSTNQKQVDEYIEKYNEVVRRRDETANSVAQCELMVEKNNAEIAVLLGEVSSLEEKEGLYQENKEVIENCAELNAEKEENNSKIGVHDKRLASCEKALQKLYVAHGAFVERVDNLLNQQQEMENLRQEYESYDLFLRCMHPNGISYDIIKKKLPLINNEIAKVLTNVVDFEVFFEENGKRLNIFIKHPKHDARPLELGSGAEKSIAAMAIRLALLNVSTLPKPNLFILDEPGTSLDEENMEGFVRILDLIKSYFNVVLLISHLDTLKDCVDTQIIIDRQGDYACVRQ